MEREVGMAGTGGSDFCGFNPKGPRVRSEMRLGDRLLDQGTCGLDQQKTDQWWAGNQVRRCGRHLVGVAVSPSVDVFPLYLGP
ncbi:hypothetical protein CEP53_012397 [Fusarium sp. AF-6]|nr:hypothetical protein CEP53_012397 [Fusarium sp. AF-6]